MNIFKYRVCRFGYNDEEIDNDDGEEYIEEKREKAQVKREYSHVKYIV